MIIQEELVESCKRGDPVAYTILYNQHSKEVYNTIIRLVDHTAEAEDILQESFVTAFEQIDSFRNTGAFKAWVKRIAINKSIDRIRKRKIRFVELEPECIYKEDEKVDETTFDLTLEAVTAAIEALSQGARTIFKLFAIENIPHAEIAKMLDMEHSAVRTQYHRARQRILSALYEGGFHEK